MKRGRNSIRYKINMWFYRLTFQDIKNMCGFVRNVILDFIIAVMGFIVIFILPALFH